MSRAQRGVRLRVLEVRGIVATVMLLVASGSWIRAVAGILCVATSLSCSPAPSTPAGPAPLRRLSNSEYLSVLQDTFPTVRATLPTLPSDTVVAGFDNAAESQLPTDVRISRFEEIANLYAEQVTSSAAEIRAVTGCESWATPSEAMTCSTQFIDRMGTKLFRRPLNDSERDRFRMRFQTWQTTVDFEAAVRLTLSAMLQSPQFLYRPEPNPTALPFGLVLPMESYAMASRLSFLLWQSAPDSSLLDAAARGELATAEQVRAQATRMLADPRAKRVYWDFHRQWLGLDRVLNDEHVVRTPEVDPQWTGESAKSAWNESKLFVENTLFATGSFRELLTSRKAWVNGEMARIYGVTPSGDPLAYTEVTLPEQERAGLLTRAAFLAGYSHRGGTTPPIRGNALLLRVMCKTIAAPPPGVDLSQPMQNPNVGVRTNRQLFEERTDRSGCMSCHTALNGYGFGLENYSASGAYRTMEFGLPIDASGQFSMLETERPFRGALELSQGLAESRTVGRCVVQQWFRYALGRAPTLIEEPMVDKWTDTFMANGGDERELLVNIVSSPSLRFRVTGEP